jgi:ABC-2 type transport system permease protein
MRCLPPVRRQNRRRPAQKDGLGAHLANIYRLTIKELRSIRADPIMLVLVVFAFTIFVYTVATGAKMEATNLAVGIVDEDRSDLSRRIADGLTPPLFKPAVEIAATDIDAAMDAGRLVFVIEIPPGFQADVLAGREASVQVNVDATAITQAGNGTIYIQSIVANEVAAFKAGREGASALPINVVVHAKFNPNLTSSWFTSVMQVINNITLLTVILTGAALIREREQGTRSCWRRSWPTASSPSWRPCYL